MTAAKDFLHFVNSSPSPFHAVETAQKLLLSAEFVQLREKDVWNIKPGGRYYTTRNGSSIVAFAVGNKWKPGNGIGIFGAHTDSPCFKVKPNSASSSNGYLQVGVEVYGGALFNTWFDRDLSVAGRLMVRDGAKIVSKLVRVDKPILRIPNLAIHLDRDQDRKTNRETDLLPILGLLNDQLNSKDSATESEHTSTDFEPLGEFTERHHSDFVKLLASEAAVEPSSILDFELYLYDTQKSVIGGIHDEFIFSPRLDNQCSCFTSVSGLIQSLENNSLDEEDSIRMVALFDHEEVGSTSAQGANSDYLIALFNRLSQAHPEANAKSVLVSADMAHAIHPNYSAKHEKQHAPKMNKGPVIKINANQRYATSSVGIVLIEEIARIGKIPLQNFVVRNDSPCGSTIGPMLAAKLGICTIDIGNPQLAMHSIREMCGSKDVEYGTSLAKEFFINFSKVFSAMEV